MKNSLIPEHLREPIQKICKESNKTFLSVKNTLIETKGVDEGLRRRKMQSGLTLDNLHKFLQGHTTFEHRAEHEIEHKKTITRNEYEEINNFFIHTPFDEIKNNLYTMMQKEIPHNPEKI